MDVEVATKSRNRPDCSNRQNLSIQDPRPSGHKLVYDRLALDDRSCHVQIGYTNEGEGPYDMPVSQCTDGTGRSIVLQRAVATHTDREARNSEMTPQKVSSILTAEEMP